MRELNKNIKEKLYEYVSTRDKYYVNALKYIGKREYRKASEFLWGAIAESIKIIALLRYKRVFKHPEFFEFLRQLSKESKDPELYESFHLLNNLHRNFYDEIIDPEDFDIYLRKTAEFLIKMEEIAKKLMR